MISVTINLQVKAESLSMRSRLGEVPSSARGKLGATSERKTTHDPATEIDMTERVSSQGSTLYTHTQIF